MPVGHLHFPVGKISVWVFHSVKIELLVFLMLSHMNCLYMLDINPLRVISFANIFSHSLVCLFVSSFLCCAKAFKFDKVPLVYFCFISFILGNGSKKYSFDLC